MPLRGGVALQVLRDVYPPRAWCASLLGGEALRAGALRLQAYVLLRADGAPL